MFFNLLLTIFFSPFLCKKLVFFGILKNLKNEAFRYYFGGENRKYRNFNVFFCSFASFFLDFTSNWRRKIEIRCESKFFFDRGFYFCGVDLFSQPLYQSFLLSFSRKPCVCWFGGKKHVFWDLTKNNVWIPHNMPISPIIFFGGFTFTFNIQWNLKGKKSMHFFEGFDVGAPSLIMGGQRWQPGSFKHFSQYFWTIFFFPTRFKYFFPHNWIRTKSTGFLWACFNFSPLSMDILGYFFKYFNMKINLLPSNTISHIFIHCGWWNKTCRKYSSIWLGGGVVKRQDWKEISCSNFQWKRDLVPLLSLFLKRSLSPDNNPKTRLNGSTPP